MVKNTGGNKSKRQGRKHVNTPQQRNVRYIKEDGEIYAVITKMFGGPNCQAMCMDGVARLCIIRNKFRGRDKRDNTISVNSWVLVGLRDWEARSDGKLEKCDLLEVYSQSDKEKIKSNGVHNVKHLISATEESTLEDENCGFDIVDNDTNIYKNELENRVVVANEGVDDETGDGDIGVGAADEDIIDIDEI